MPGFTGDTLASYGGALQDASPVIDPTTDLGAASGNKWSAATAGMTHTAIRAWARITLSPGGVGTANPVLVFHDAMWGNAIGVAPVPLYSASPGLYSMSWASTQSDEIPFGFPGYTGPTAINFRAGFANVRPFTTWYCLGINIVSSASIQIMCFNSSGAFTNPAAATDIDVFLI